MKTFYLYTSAMHVQRKKRGERWREREGERGRKGEKERQRDPSTNYKANRLI